MKLWNWSKRCIGSKSSWVKHKTSISSDILVAQNIFLPGCLSAPKAWIQEGLKCWTVQMFKCWNVQMFKCSNVQMLNWATDLLTGQGVERRPHCRPGCLQYNGMGWNISIKGIFISSSFLLPNFVYDSEPGERHDPWVNREPSSEKYVARTDSRQAKGMRGGWGWLFRMTFSKA